MGDEYPTVTAAAVQAAPVFLDRERTVTRVRELIVEAGDGGADLVVFPEGFLPGHPSWFKFHAASGELAQQLSRRLFANAVTVPGPATEAIAAAADSADVYVVVGVCEKEPDTTGTMYNSQLYFSPEGELLGKHQKLKPTLGEQLVHAEGNPETFGTFETEYGPMSGLICGENSNPLATFALMAEHTRVHCMSWPPCFKSTAPMPEKVRIAAQGFAYTSKAYVVSAAGVLDDRMVELLELTNEQAAAVRTPERSGGSLVVAPNGDVVAGPLDAEPDILYADLDLEAGVVGKLTHDFAGHYNRPDVFELRVDRTSNALFTSSTGEPVSSDDPDASSSAAGTASAETRGSARGQDDEAGDPVDDDA